LRTVSAIPSNVVDWVLIELRSSTTSPAIGYRSAFLRYDGVVVGDDGIDVVPVDVPAGDYFIVIRHRNHLAVMSKDDFPVALSSYPDVATLYDFTTGSDQFHGGSAGAIQIDTSPIRWGMISGDGNSNGQVQNDDSENIWKPENGTPGYKNSDFNLNGQVQNDDNENYWKPNNGRGSQVPNL
jgi:hypothetical protein